MENKFKVGDKVKCVDVSWQGAFKKNELKLGNEYTIKAIAKYDYLMFVETDEDSWLPSRFKLVEEEPSVMGVSLNLGQESTGTKHDSSKPDLSLIPTDALWGMAEALTYGAKKYERHNFRKGIAYSRLVAACMRHLTAWNEGEDIDSESGLSHIDHAMASLAMLKFMNVNRQDMDDRWLNPIHEHDKHPDEKKSITEKALETFPKNDGKNR